jgi:hypothetical protein
MMALSLSSPTTCWRQQRSGEKGRGSSEIMEDTSAAMMMIGLVVVVLTLCWLSDDIGAFLLKLYYILRQKIVSVRKTSENVGKRGRTWENSVSKDFPIVIRSVVCLMKAPIILPRRWDQLRCLKGLKKSSLASIDTPERLRHPERSLRCSKSRRKARRRKPKKQRNFQR